MWLDKLRVMKERSGMTTKEISKASGIPEPTLEKLFAGATKDPKLPTMQKLVHFLGYTLDDLDDLPVKPKKTMPYSPEACKLAEDFDKKLDSWGRRTVRAVVDEEVARCEDESRFLMETAPEEEPKIIPLYLFPAAAGYASPVFNEDYEDYELKPEDPQGAMFAVRLQGDSMEPDFPDGSIVFCNKDPMADGDIGIFSVDSGSVCKQYHKEGGVVYLFSLNRARQDADVVLFPSGNRPLSCQGRVITRKRYKVPGR